jgi:hypothetical protein
LAGDLHVLAVNIQGPGPPIGAPYVASNALWHTIRRADGSWPYQFGDAGSLLAHLHDSPPYYAVACATNAIGDLHVIAKTDLRIWHTIRLADGSWPYPFGNVARTMALLRAPPTPPAISMLLPQTFRKGGFCTRSGWLTAPGPIPFSSCRSQISANSTALHALPIRPAISVFLPDWRSLARFGTRSGAPTAPGPIPLGMWKRLPQTSARRWVARVRPTRPATFMFLLQAIRRARSGTQSGGLTARGPIPSEMWKGLHQISA